jgi:Uncharacterised protein family (UPF0014)
MLSQKVLPPMVDSSVCRMMTGQLLAGQNPYQAAAYQVAIFFLITSTVCVTVLTLTRLALHALVDQSNHRLRTADLELTKRKVSSSQKIKWDVLPSKLTSIIRRQSDKDDELLLNSEVIEAEMMLTQSKRPTVGTYVDLSNEDSFEGPLACSTITLLQITTICDVPETSRLFQPSVRTVRSWFFYEVVVAKIDF